MKRKMNFITKMVLILFMLVGYISFNSIYAAEKNTVTFTTNPPIPGTSDETDPLDDDLVFDLYYIAPIEWDGKGDGTNPESTKYYIPSSEISSTYSAVFTDDMKDTDGNINVSMRDEKYENAALSDSVLKDMANSLAGIIYSGSNNPDHTGLSFDETHPKEGEDTIENGLYLAIVRGSSSKNTDKTKYFKTKTETIEDTESGTSSEKTVYYTFVNSYFHEYDFDPCLVFVKNSDNNAELKVNVKYSINYRYDDLKIIKTLTGFAGHAEGDDESKGLNFSGFEPVTFVFSVKAYDPEDDKTLIYEDVCAITFDSISKIEDLTKYTILEKFPVGSRVEVEEIYGRSYELDNTDNPQQTTIIVSTKNAAGEYLEIASVEFKNKFSDDPREGYGFDNPFKYTSEGWHYEGVNTCELPN